MGRTCCVVNCKNNLRNSSCKFYAFPTSKWTLQQRQKWIAAVNRKNADGSPWHPKRHDTICSEHFIGGKKSDEEASPSYIPTIFPSMYRCKKMDHSQVTAGYNRFMTQRYPDQQFIVKYEQNQLPIETVTIKTEFTMTADKGCQADIYNQFRLKETTFICNRYIQNYNCDAEIQVEIPTTSKIVTTNTPKTKDTICSEHFIGSKKSDAEASPSYIPTIFPSMYRCKKMDHSQVTAGYNRFMTQRYPDQQFIVKYEQNQIPIETVTIKMEFTMTADKGCQADIYNQFRLKETTFICNRYIQNYNCDAEIQVEIPTTFKIVTINTPKTEDIGCCTTKVTSIMSQDFVGISSIKNDQQLQDLAGVTFKSFNILLRRMKFGKCVVSKKDGLLIFLMKFKTRLSFSALGVLFGIHRTTISRIFYHTLHSLQDQMTSPELLRTLGPLKAIP